MSIVPKRVVLAHDTPESQESKGDHRCGEDPPKQSTSWLQFGLRVGCTVILLFFLMRSISWQGVVRTIPSLDGGELLIGIVVGLSGVIVSAYQWQSLLDAEYIHIDLRRLINFYLVGIAFNHFLPTGMGGDMIKAYYTGSEGQNSVGATSAVILSRITGFIGMLLLSLPALLIWRTLFPKSLTMMFLLACLAMCGALVGTFCAATLFSRFLQGRLGKYKAVSFVLKLGKALRMSFKQPRTTAVAIAFGMLFHLSAALNYYGYALVLHLHVPFAFYLVAVPLVSLIAFLPISINGFGLRETTFLYIFTTIHVLPTTTFLIAILMDLQALLFGVLGGFIYLSIGMKKDKSSHGAK